MNTSSLDVFIYVLGTAQDGGYPHAGCKENCCNSAWKDSSLKRFASCISLIDQNKKIWRQN